VSNTLYAHTFGADPEVFIVGGKTIETPFGRLPKLIPPQSLIQDHGVEPEIIKDKVVLYKNKNFQWSEDGAAIEMQMSPATDFAAFRSTVQAGLVGLQQFLKGFGMSVYKNPLAVFDLDEYWNNRDESFRECVIFGCDPDMFPELYIEYGLDEESEEIDVSEHEYRYGGGHIHIQAPENDPEVFMRSWPEAATVFDFTAGLANVVKKRSTKIEQQEMARLDYYGRPGRIRLQEYDAKNGVFGIEYRVLSNYWVSNPVFMNRLLMTLDFAARILEKERGEEFIEEFMDDIPVMYETILDRNRPAAIELLNRVTKWAFENDIMSLELLSSLHGGKS
jgi:hypothetical protein